MSSQERKEKGRWSALLRGKVKDLLWIAILAIALFYTAWKIFKGDEKDQTASLQLSDTEVKVSRILQEIDGVGEANVVVYEENGEVKSVVVVCEGGNDLRVIMDVREAVAATLGTEEKVVKVYVKKE